MSSDITKTAEAKKADKEVAVEEVVVEEVVAEEAPTEVPAEVSLEEKKAPKGAGRSAGKSRKRIPLGTRNVLTAEKRPGYARRFVNDKGDRIQAFKDAGWSAVETEGQTGDDRAGRSTSMGSSANPSVGGGQRAVLMEIPEEYHDEDNRVKQAKIAQVENEIKRNSSTPGQDGLDGKISIT